MRIPLAIAAAIFALTASEAAAQVARIEYRPFQSLTLKDSELLSGKQEGQPVTLAPGCKAPPQK